MSTTIFDRVCSFEIQGVADPYTGKKSDHYVYSYPCLNAATNFGHQHHEAEAVCTIQPKKLGETPEATVARQKKEREACSTYLQDSAIPKISNYEIDGSVGFCRNLEQAYEWDFDLEGLRNDDGRIHVLKSNTNLVEKYASPTQSERCFSKNFVNSNMLLADRPSIQWKRFLKPYGKDSLYWYTVGQGYSAPENSRDKLLLLKHYIDYGFIGDEAHVRAQKNGLFDTDTVGEWKNPVIGYKCSQLEQQIAVPIIPEDYEEGDDKLFDYRNIKITAAVPTEGTVADIDYTDMVRDLEANFKPYLFVANPAYDNMVLTCKKQMREVGPSTVDPKTGYRVVSDNWAAKLELNTDVEHKAMLKFDAPAQTGKAWNLVGTVPRAARPVRQHKDPKDVVEGEDRERKELTYFWYDKKLKIDEDGNIYLKGGTPASSYSVEYYMSGVCGFESTELCSAETEEGSSCADGRYCLPENEKPDAQEYKNHCLLVDKSRRPQRVTWANTSTTSNENAPDSDKASCAADAECIGLQKLNGAWKQFAEVPADLAPPTNQIDVFDSEPFLGTDPLCVQLLENETQGDWSDVRDHCLTYSKEGFGRGLACKQLDPTDCLADSRCKTKNGVCTENKKLNLLYSRTCKAADAAVPELTAEWRRLFVLRNPNASESSCSASAPFVKWYNRLVAGDKDSVRASQTTMEKAFCAAPVCYQQVLHRGELHSMTATNVEKECDKVKQNICKIDASFGEISFLDSNGLKVSLDNVCVMPQVHKIYPQGCKDNANVCVSKALYDFRLKHHMSKECPLSVQFNDLSGEWDINVDTSSKLYTSQVCGYFELPPMETEAVVEKEKYIIRDYLKECIDLMSDSRKFRLVDTLHPGGKIMGVGEFCNSISADDWLGNLRSTVVGLLDKGKNYCYSLDQTGASAPNSCSTAPIIQSALMLTKEVPMSLKAEKELETKKTKKKQITYSYWFLGIPVALLVVIGLVALFRK